MASKLRTNLTPEKKRERFLDALRNEPNVSAAARASGYSRRYLYDLRDSDSEFAKAWDEAIEEALDAAEGELHRRAVKGVRKPVYHAGVRVGYIQEYSDTLLIFYLKTRGKHRGYVERQEVDSRNSGEMTIRVVYDDQDITTAEAITVAEPNSD